MGVREVPQHGRSRRRHGRPARATCRSSLPRPTHRRSRSSGRASPGTRWRTTSSLAGPSNLATAGPVIGDYDGVQTARARVVAADVHRGHEREGGGEGSGERGERRDAGVQLARRRVAATSASAREDDDGGVGAAADGVREARPGRRRPDGRPARSAQLVGDLDHLARAPTRRAARPSRAGRRSGSPGSVPPGSVRAVVDEARAAHRARRARAPRRRGARARRRCPGTRRRRGRPGPMPASSYAASAASVLGGVIVESSTPLIGVASPSTEPGRCERSAAAATTGAAGVLAARRGAATTAAAPSFGEHSMWRCSGSHTSRDASTSSVVVGLRNIAFGLSTPLARFFTTTRARCSLVTPDSRISRWRAEREVRGRRREPRLLAPRLEERRPDDALGHLLDAEHEHGVVLPGSDGAGREHQRGAAARAAGLDVDDRHAGQPERAEHLVPGRDARVHGRAERGLERRGCPRRRARRCTARDAHVGDRDVRRTGRTGACRCPRSTTPARHVAVAAGANEYVVSVVAVVVGAELDERRGAWAAEREARRVGLLDAADHAQPFRQLDDAEAERHLAHVAGRGSGHRGPAPQRSRSLRGATSSMSPPRTRGTSTGAGTGADRTHGSAHRRGTRCRASSSPKSPSRDRLHTTPSSSSAAHAASSSPSELAEDGVGVLAEARRAGGRGQRFADDARERAPAGGAVRRPGRRP